MGPDDEFDPDVNGDPDFTEDLEEHDVDPAGDYPEDAEEQDDDEDTDP